MILAKIVEILLKLSRLRPQGCPGGSDQIFLAIIIRLVFFCAKTFVVRPTSDPKKLKFVKIPPKLVENRQNTPWGPFWRSDQKFFYKMFQHINTNIFLGQKFCSKINNKKIPNFSDAFGP